MEEVFKPIKGFESLYEISNLGNIRSIDHYTNAKGGSKRLVKGRLLNPYLGKNGYYSISLSNLTEGVSRKYIHRLVAETFLPNPNNYDVVNHKDENPKNNCVDNLEWCTQKYNMEYSNTIEKAHIACKGKYNQETKSKPIEGYDDNNNVIVSFPSLMEGHRNGFDFRLVSACCLGKRNYHKGLHWRFV